MRSLHSDVLKNSWVSTVEASRFDEATAYATFDRHTFGDMKPYAYKTADYGKTWTSLNVQENGAIGYAHVIKEDTVDSNLLFLGTELGLWISYDGGTDTGRSTSASNFPSAAVRDIVVQARESDLVLATHGRGIWIIDDISPLRALTPDLMAKDAVLLEGRPAIQYFQANGGWAEGDETFNGPGRPGGCIHHLLPEGPPHFRRPEDRDSRLGWQVGGHGPGQQASWAKPCHLVDAAESSDCSRRLRVLCLPPPRACGLCPAPTPSR